MNNVIFAKILLALAALLLFALPSTAVMAHGHIEVGEYELELGFMNEPAYQGQPNAMELHVAHHETGQTVNGLENSLSVEIIYGASKKTLTLRPGAEEGSYTASVIPTEAGDYTFHITGQIIDTPVDVSMTSSPETFGSVQPLSDFTFPGLAGNGENAQAGLNQASQMATWGLIAGVVGALLGLAGLITALSARSSVRRVETDQRAAAGQ